MYLHLLVLEPLLGVHYLYLMNLARCQNEQLLIILFHTKFPHFLSSEAMVAKGHPHGPLVLRCLQHPVHL